jgi:DNA-binding beta-propeller fold protein YncE
MKRALLLAALTVALAFRTLVQAQVPLSAFVNFEGAQTRPITLSRDRTRLYALNTPDNRLSVFSLANPAAPVLISEIPVGIEPVSVNINPGNSDEVWVANQESNSISVVSVSKGIVTDTIACKPEPSDVLLYGANAYVSVSRSNTINVFSIATHALTKSIPVFGKNPRALALSLDGASVYAAFALSGNHSTILPMTYAPPQPKPTNKSLPAPPQVGLIIDASDPNWTSVINYKMPDNDVVAIDTTKLAVKKYFPGVGTINLGLAVRPGTGDLFVSNTNARNLIRFIENLQGHWVDNRVTAITMANGQITPYDLNPTINYTVLPNPTALSTALAQPAGLVFDPSGNFLWLAAFGTDRVAKVSPTGQVLNMVEIGPATGSQVSPATKRGPRGLALFASAQILYVLNRISNSISMVNTSTNSLLGEIPIGSFNPTPTVIVNGRGFLYDAKLSGNGTGACASCHVDADMDFLAWDLGDPNGSMTTVVDQGRSFTFHPMKGPFTTRTLRGIVNTDPLHWRGDIPNFSGFNTLFSTLLGGNQLSSSDMSAYEAFIDTLTLLPNPNQNLDRSLPVSFHGGNAVNGETDFQTNPINGNPADTCSSCHAFNPGPGSNFKIVVRTNLFQPMKVATLRNVYQKLDFNNAAGANSIDGFGITQDGSFATLFQLLASVVLGGFPHQTELDAAAFMKSFDTGMAPAVGYARTVTGANVTSTSITSDWTLLQNQAIAGNIDLIIKGTANGQLHGFLYQPSSGTYEIDTVTQGPYTQAQLINLISDGDTMTIMGVPPGSGVRMGIDRNLGPILDGDQP